MSLPVSQVEDSWQRVRDTEKQPGVIAEQVLQRTGATGRVFTFVLAMSDHAQRITLPSISHAWCLRVSHVLARFEV